MKMTSEEPERANPLREDWLAKEILEVETQVNEGDWPSRWRRLQPKADKKLRRDLILNTNPSEAQ